MNEYQPDNLNMCCDILHISYVFISHIVRMVTSRRIKWVAHVAHMGKWRDVFKVLVGKPEGEKPFGMSRCRWEDNIEMDLQEVGCGGFDWIALAQDRDRWRALANAVMNLWVL
jgi:hypothetical protein